MRTTIALYWLMDDLKFHSKIWKVHLSTPTRRRVAVNSSPSVYYGTPDTLLKIL